MTFRKAVFLDRDGTLNPDPGYISRPEDYRLFPWVGGELRRLREAGFLLVLATNQSGIARGVIRPAALEAIHAKMNTELGQAGAALDAIYFCPHHHDFPTPDQPLPCLCRKPSPGMIFAAQADLGIDLSASFAIGDRITDAQTAINAGVRPILLVEPGTILPTLTEIKVVGSFSQAVDWILAQAG